MMPARDIQLCKKIKKFPEWVTSGPSDQLIYHGNLLFYSDNTQDFKVRHIFVFNKALLVTKSIQKKKKLIPTSDYNYKIRLLVNLHSDIKLAHDPEGLRFVLQVPVKGASYRSLIFVTNNKHEKETWIDKIKVALSSNMKHSHTYNGYVQVEIKKATSEPLLVRPSFNKKRTQESVNLMDEPIKELKKIEIGQDLLTFCDDVETNPFKNSADIHRVQEGDDCTIYRFN